MSDLQYQHTDSIVSSAWLADHQNDKNLRIFECTMYLQYDSDGKKPVTSRNARPEFEEGHIPGAGYFDLQADLSDNESPFRFTMLNSEALAKNLARKGIGNETRVVLYSRDTLQWSTRIWWMLRSLGFDNAAVLDGGFPTWLAEGRPISTAETRYVPMTLTPAPRLDLFVNKRDVASAMFQAGVSTINALSPSCHSGEDARYGRPGRIPGSVNIPAGSLQDKISLLIRPAAEVAADFSRVGADKTQRIIVYCGGGIAASLDAFLLYQLGYTNVAIYDNSMTEWANDYALPMETDW